MARRCKLRVEFRELRQSVSSAACALRDTQPIAACRRMALKRLDVGLAPAREAAANKKLIPERSILFEKQDRLAVRSRSRGEAD